MDATGREWYVHLYQHEYREGIITVLSRCILRKHLFKMHFLFHFIFDLLYLVVAKVFESLVLKWVDVYVKPHGG